eukprot:PhM_4_TR5362/c0_g1_i1/m.29089/K04522/PSEN2, PS2; presenilin 2
MSNAHQHETPLLDSTDEVEPHHHEIRDPITDESVEMTPMFEHTDTDNGIAPQHLVCNEPGDAIARNFSNSTMALLYPVSLCMVIVVWAVRNFTPLYADQHQQPIPMVVTEKSTDTAAEKVQGGAINSVVLICVFVGITMLLLALYKMRFRRLLIAYLMISAGSVLFLLAWVWIDLFCVKFQIPYDWVSVILVLYNFGVVGIVTLFFHGHIRLQQAYLIAVSSIIGWTLTRIPEWTTWVILISISVYDIFAVLTPKGPLKMLVEAASSRDEAIPAFVYDSDHGLKLGLGDFIFYSVLVGRAAMYSLLTCGCSFVAILFGLSATLFFLGMFKKALPALPISISLGTVVYFLARFVASPYAFANMMNGVWM